MLDHVLTYELEDGTRTSTGDGAFDYYNMRPGAIGRDCSDGWFDFAFSDERGAASPAIRRSRRSGWRRRRR